MSFSKDRRPVPAGTAEQLGAGSSHLVPRRFDPAGAIPVLPHEPPAVTGPFINHLFNDYPLLVLRARKNCHLPRIDSRSEFNVSRILECFAYASIAIGRER
jgi:hypothetical protein